MTAWANTVKTDVLTTVLRRRKSRGAHQASRHYPASRSGGGVVELAACQRGRGRGGFLEMCSVVIGNSSLVCLR